MTTNVPAASRQVYMDLHPLPKLSHVYDAATGNKITNLMGVTLIIEAAAHTIAELRFRDGTKETVEVVSTTKHPKTKLTPADLGKRARGLNFNGNTIEGTLVKVYKVHGSPHVEIVDDAGTIFQVAEKNVELIGSKFTSADVGKLVVVNDPTVLAKPFHGLLHDVENKHEVLVIDHSQGKPIYWRGHPDHVEFWSASSVPVPTLNAGCPECKGTGEVPMFNLGPQPCSQGCPTP